MKIARNYIRFRWKFLLSIVISTIFSLMLVEEFLLFPLIEEQTPETIILYYAFTNPFHTYDISSLLSNTFILYYFVFHLFLVSIAILIQNDLIVTLRNTLISRISIRRIYLISTLLIAFVSSIYIALYKLISLVHFAIFYNCKISNAMLFLFIKNNFFITMSFLFILLFFYRSLKFGALSFLIILLIMIIQYYSYKYIDFKLDSFIYLITALMYLIGIYLIQYEKLRE